MCPWCLREPLSDCLKDVDLIPPFNRMPLEVTFGKLYSWAIHNVRNILLEAGARFKELGQWLLTPRGYDGMESYRELF